MSSLFLMKRMRRPKVGLLNALLMMLCISSGLGVVLDSDQWKLTSRTDAGTGPCIEMRPYPGNIKFVTKNGTETSVKYISLKAIVPHFSEVGISILSPSLSLDRKQLASISSDLELIELRSSETGKVERTLKSNSDILYCRVSFNKTDDVLQVNCYDGFIEIWNRQYPDGLTGHFHRPLVLAFLVFVIMVACRTVMVFIS